MSSFSVVVPTRNESDNIAELVTRLVESGRERLAEVLFVDDSDDDTPAVVAQVSRTAGVHVRLVHRRPTDRNGGLAGAVVLGLVHASCDLVVVMDGDLQHPPELSAVLAATAVDAKADVVVASRYQGGGDASGLSSRWRRGISGLSTLLAQACFPRRVGRVCTDPMTGFFCIRRSAVDMNALRPRGFKILLEILARHELRVAEVPFVFGARMSGRSKASWRNGAAFLRQLLGLRMGNLSRFAAVGALGTVLNIALMAVLLRGGVHYLPAALVASEVAILHNFLLQERFVFRRLTASSRPGRERAALFFAANNVEMVLRSLLLVPLVTGIGIAPLVAQSLTLGVAFLARFVFVTKVVYRARPLADGPPLTAELVDLTVVEQLPATRPTRAGSIDE